QNSGGISKTLQDETSCPICLEYFKDPVVLDCDHNFCRACITQCWEGSQTLSCPQCRQTCPEKNLRPNRQLRNIVEAARGLRLQSAREAETEGLCEKHREPLKLFCKDDQIPICVVCDRSKEHRDHRVIPAEEAAEEFKVRPSVVLQPEPWEPLPPAVCVCEWQGRGSTLCSFGAAGGGGRAPIGQGWGVGCHQIMMEAGRERAAHSGGIGQNQDHQGWIIAGFDTALCVLGREGFTSGRHCWEVEVGGWQCWGVGVARESVQRKREISYSPEEGIWAVWRWEDQFWALTSPKTLLPQSRVPSRIRVCLDCDWGQVTFFRAGDEAPIFTFLPGSVPGERIRPWLWVWDTNTGLRLCP
uniref:Uncharacterized protein n=1 Tax=Pelusios castaneus TaxID=367368 RepID=A0A8C8RJQ4_9SAUR